jgi:probable FeS assembly SUF system protein SufT
MTDEGFIPLSRDIQATRIPTGETVLLAAETPVIITQALGGSYTVHVGHQSGLFRIKNSDADALGKEIVDVVPVAEGPFEEEKAWAQLRNCYDPEIPVNIVDLGLIYSLEATDAPAGGKHVDVKMTLTAPGCGMGPSLAADAEQRLLTVPGVSSATVSLVWEPSWSPALISPAGKEKLGMV